jgi:hypothetical protein
VPPPSVEGTRTVLEHLGVTGRAADHFHLPILSMIVS